MPFIKTMTDTELIQKIQELKQIKPKQDWAFSAKNQILSQEVEKKPSVMSEFVASARVIFSNSARYYNPAFLKPTFALTACFAVFVGVFGLTQSAMPGNVLYPIKKVAETAQVNFSPEHQKAEAHLRLANDRLEDLKKIAESNKMSLKPALKEFQANVAGAIQDWSAVDPDSEAIKGIAKEAKKLKDNMEEVLALGVEFNTESAETVEKIDTIVLASLKDAITNIESEISNKVDVAVLAEREIQALENSSLTEEQEELLQEAKAYYLAEDYTDALIKIWEIGQTQAQ